MLKLKNIVKDYHVADMDVHALRGINLEFRKSEFVSILGPSGCGKTTLLNIVGGLDRYTRGDLIINGRSTKDYTAQDWDSYRNHSIGFVFQTYNLIHHQSVLGNVELALTLSGISPSDRKKRAIQALNEVGLSDQLYKKPNQLSGGQMQRVAIARALVNDPDILLADEPTGALDTETSVQIMELIKEISKDRLVIMVTHNAILADRYSTRIVRLLDGEIIGDSNPFNSDKPVVVETKKENKIEKTSMSFFTALMLSLKNLATKKTRTLLTAFAGSIGIIGIALVLALSSGFQNYIDKMQMDTLSNYPLVISKTDTDYSAVLNFQRPTGTDKYPQLNEVIINKIMEFLSTSGFNIENDLTEEYITNVIQNGIDPSLYYAIDYSYGVDLQLFRRATYFDTEYYQRISTNAWSKIIETSNPENPYDFIEKQYDVLAGSLPSSKNHIVLVVNDYNQVSDFVLTALGLYTDPSQETIPFDELIGQTFSFLLNDALFSFDGTKFVRNAFTLSGMTLIDKNMVDNQPQNVIELEIVGIVRLNEDTAAGAINGSIGYTNALIDAAMEHARDSAIVTWMQEEANVGKDPFTGTMYIETTTSALTQWENRLQSLGGIQKPTRIQIYPLTFEAKEQIKRYLDDYNREASSAARAAYFLELGITEAEATEEQLKEADIAGRAAGVYYTDIMEVIVGSMNTVINSISYVLIAFTAVSLVVSSIMIGIITYISVLERTKEIGILRSIGARKKDISRVFNAETLIIGFTAGLLGVVVTLLLSIPINFILYRLVDVRGIAQLLPQHAITLIFISMGLTLIAGIIPSRIAANKDPVVALRTE